MYVLHGCIGVTLSVSKTGEEYLIYSVFPQSSKRTRQVYLRSARTLKIFHEKFSLIDLPGMHPIWISHATHQFLRRCSM